MWCFTKLSLMFSYVDATLCQPILSAGGMLMSACQKFCGATPIFGLFRFFLWLKKIRDIDLWSEVNGGKIVPVSKKSRFFWHTLIFFTRKKKSSEKKVRLLRFFFHHDFLILKT